MHEVPRDDAREGLRALIDELGRVPAVVRDRHLTVIAATPLAKALSPGFAEGVNLARFTFLDAADEAAMPCWADASRTVAAMLRESLDAHDEDGPFRGLVGELSAKSARFSEEWADDAHPAHTGTATFVHEAIGSLTLNYREEWLDDSRDTALIVWSGASAESAQRLSRLGELVSS